MPASNWSVHFRARSGAQNPTLFRFVFAAVSGALLSLSYTGFYLSVYAWLCVALLLMLVLNARPRVAFGCGFLHGFFFVLTSLPWIATVLMVHGGVSRVGGWGVLAVVASAFGILAGTFAWIVRILAGRNITLACVGAPFAWVMMEFARAHLPEIGFPWNLLGYPASSNLGLLQLTTVTGIYGLSFLVAAFNALLVWMRWGSKPILKWRLVALGATAVTIVTVMLVGPLLVPDAVANHYARGVQVNLPELDQSTGDWFTGHSADMAEIERMSLAPSAKHPDLLIWPEAPAPFSFEDPRFTNIASSIAQNFHHPFLVGSIEWHSQEDGSSAQQKKLVPFNSAVLVSAQGLPIFKYDKVHLVPFGEYEPFPMIDKLVASVSGEVGGFHKGTKYAVGHLPGGYAFGTFICYEAIFPAEVRHFAANGGELFINISNDGWFGRSAAAEQHLHMARVRAVENRRWILRVTNNGYTVSVDPYGRIYSSLPTDVRAAVDLPYDFRTDDTIYTRYGDWFAWLCVLVSIILLITTFRKVDAEAEIVTPSTVAASTAPAMTSA